ncbi:UNKNOWN [Stylonychia lemnae]|uniref:Uncharacterized protein n=1 Tax=Stylonychia lemnae TaxID=5949 RepID=A0A078B5L3_STYLE|nr:UNKNOWN [Stylonychia lemnae]|eukprot:CDW89704.1 UNKNOWN [Stylonychia lemnae]
MYVPKNVMNKEKGRKQLKLMISNYFHQVQGQPLRQRRASKENRTNMSDENSKGKEDIILLLSPVQSESNEEQMRITQRKFVLSPLKNKRRGMYEQSIDGIKNFPDIEQKPKYHINHLQFKDVNIKQCQSVSIQNKINIPNMKTQDQALKLSELTNNMILNKDSDIISWRDTTTSDSMSSRNLFSSNRYSKLANSGIRIKHFYSRQHILPQFSQSNAINQTSSNQSRVFQGKLNSVEKTAKRHLFQRMHNFQINTDTSYNDQPTSNQVTPGPYTMKGIENKKNVIRSMNTFFNEINIKKEGYTPNRDNQSKPLIFSIETPQVTRNQFFSRDNNSIYSMNKRYKNQFQSLQMRLNRQNQDAVDIKNLISSEFNNDARDLQSQNEQQELLEIEMHIKDFQNANQKRSQKDQNQKIQKFLQKI